ncbi:MAG: hypothetical protein HYY26_00655 [Acidobacteria bacterium]|nr:hypothetical protein [Acidobacteriota bacterium]
MLAVLHFVMAALMLLTGALWIWVVRSPMFAELGMENPQGMDLSDEMLWLTEMGPWAGALFLVYGGLKGASGYGLLKLRRWGRRLTIGLAALTVLLTLPGLVSALLDQQASRIILNLIVVAGYSAIIAYLLTARVKQAFGAT